MRAVEVALFLIFIVAAIPLSAMLFPTLSPLPTANASTAFVDKMNMTALEAEKPQTGIGIVDTAGYFLQLAYKSLDAGVSFILSILSSFPALVTIFNINPVLAAFLGVGVFCIFIIALVQLRKGDSFEGKR